MNKNNNTKCIHYSLCLAYVKNGSNRICKSCGKNCRYYEHKSNINIDANSISNAIMDAIEFELCK